MAAPRRQYVHAKREAKGNKWSGFSKHQTFGKEAQDIRVLLRKRGGQDGPFRLRVNDGHKFDEWGTNRKLDPTMHRIREILPNIDIGDLLDVDVSPNNLGLVRIKPVRIQAHKDRIPSGAGGPYNARVMTYIRFLNAHFHWDNWGICNKRYIAGTTTWSQHAYANAVDAHFSSMAAGDAAYRTIKANWGALDLAHLLWRVPGHYDHIHADFSPQGGAFCA